MPTVIYKTAAEWEQVFGDGQTGNYFYEKIWVDILNQLEQINSKTGEMQYIVDVTSGSTYQNDLLIGKSIYNIFYGGVRLNSNTDPAYTFNAGTGTVTFTIAIDNGIELAIDYK
jgi:hypothetical protein